MLLKPKRLPRAFGAAATDLEVWTGAASSSLTVKPHDLSSIVPSSLGASAAAADSDGVKASSSGGAAASDSAGVVKKSDLGLKEKMKRHRAAQRKMKRGMWSGLPHTACHLASLSTYCQKRLACKPDLSSTLPLSSGASAADSDGDGVKTSSS
ncbi:TPA: hypothetical protein ACH3X2_010423 [Trebouxia sp. C0005]